MAMVVGEALLQLRHEVEHAFAGPGQKNPGSNPPPQPIHVHLFAMQASGHAYRRPATAILETIFATYTVLFVGFGGTDPDLDGIVDRLSTVYERSIGQHFLLISDEEFSALERRRLLEDKRIDCITYKRDASHSQVVEFLRALSQRTKSDADVGIPFPGDRRQPRVFVSGPHRDLNLLREVAEVAKGAGFEVWFAETQLKPGDLIQDTISKAIDETDCFIAVVTDSAVASSWVHFEIGRAFGAHKKVLAIRVGDAPVPSDLTGMVYLRVEGPQLSPKDKAQIATALRKLNETDT
jgi:hypothetical protein